MRKIVVILFFITHASLNPCPTCIGLPRPHERPFFERKSFLAALQQQPNAQKQQSAPQKNAADKQSK